MFSAFSQCLSFSNHLLFRQVFVTTTQIMTLSLTRRCFCAPLSTYYSKEHEWIRVEENKEEEDQFGTVGISSYAREKLGDVVYVELPDVGSSVGLNDTIGVVESVKAVSDLFSPVSGKVIQINEGLVEDPSPINTSPEDKGWLFKIVLSNREDLQNLMTTQAYQQFLKSQHDDESPD